MAKLTGFDLVLFAWDQRENFGKLLDDLKPIIEAARPIFGRLLQSGVPPDHATAATFKILAVHQMTPEEEREFARASNPDAGGA